jgi:uncharacterized protein (UPF0218 family)
MPKTYFLPKKLKPKLRKVWGRAIFGKKSEIRKKFKELLAEKKFKKIITVGDCCSRSLPSDIKIFDGKIRRRKVKELPKFSLTFKNPAGTIQKEAWSAIKRAIKNKENVFVEGEEDLLVIPSVLLAPKNSLVVYGLHKKGICAIETNEKMKRKIKNLLKLFLKCER